MPDALRLLLTMFAAPLAGLRAVRERVPLFPALAAALFADAAYFLVTQWSWVRPAGAYGAVRYALLFLVPLLLLAFVLAPLLIFLASLLGRQLAFRELFREDYAALVACLFYVWAAACLWALPWALLGQATGWRDQLISELVRQATEQYRLPDNLPPSLLPRIAAMEIAFLTAFPFFAGGVLVAVREVFRLSWARSAALVGGSFIVGLPLAALALPLFSFVLTSPLLAVLVFLLLRGYFGALARREQSKSDFQRHLHAATQNPADASAHYNLGLIHARRNQLDEARERFARAVEIDADETDAHFQLGRIARAQGRWADAVRHFEEVVRRDETHAQHEIWRETGATYLAAQQFADARAMLERFLEARPSDPQGLYLLGRAHAGLGDREAARAALQACIEAVQNAPAFQYRAERRWLNEAQQFLRSLA
jgi:tetratricopeptide (TPR) repeat protein